MMHTQKHPTPMSTQSIMANFRTQTMDWSKEALKTAAEICVLHDAWVANEPEEIPAALDSDCGLGGCYISIHDSTGVQIAALSKYDNSPYTIFVLLKPANVCYDLLLKKLCSKTNTRLDVQKHFKIQ